MTPPPPVQKAVSRTGHLTSQQVISFGVTDSRSRDVGVWIARIEYDAPPLLSVWGRHCRDGANISPGAFHFSGDDPGALDAQLNAHVARAREAAVRKFGAGK
jgi:hypothetical protein